MTTMLVSITMFLAPLALLAWLVRSDLTKIVAALRGESWASGPAPTIRPVTVRFIQRYPSVRPMRARPRLSVAA